MFTLVRTVPLRRLLTEQAPALVISLGIAEVSFKFHSFILEAASFLVTWYVVDGVRHLITVAIRGPEDLPSERRS